MTSQQQAGPEHQTLGYCLRCGEYGRGTYAGTINSNSDTIRDHQGCKESKPGLGTEG